MHEHKKLCFFLDLSIQYVHGMPQLEKYDGTVLTSHERRTSFVSFFIMFCFTVKVWYTFKWIMKRIAMHFMQKCYLTKEHFLFSKITVVYVILYFAVFPY